MMHEDVERLDKELASCEETLGQHPDLHPAYSAEIQVAVEAIHRARVVLALLENPTEVMGGLRG